MDTSMAFLSGLDESGDEWFIHLRTDRLVTPFLDARCLIGDDTDIFSILKALSEYNWTVNVSGSNNKIKLVPHTVLMKKAKFEITTMNNDDPLIMRHHMKLIESRAFSGAHAQIYGCVDSYLMKFLSKDEK